MGFHGSERSSGANMQKMGYLLDGKLDFSVVDFQMTATAKRDSWISDDMQGTTASRCHCSKMDWAAACKPNPICRLPPT